MKSKKTLKVTHPLDISVPVSMLRSGRVVKILIVLFLFGLIYLSFVLVTQSRTYMARSGRTTYGKVLDRNGDVLFDGSKPLTDYPAGQFADVGNFIGDTSGQMSNTLVKKNLTDLANFSFSTSGEGKVSLNTTLDHAANQAVFKKFGKKNGSCIACNWKTGELLVCLSKPCVDIAKGYDNIAKMESGSLICKAFSPTVPGSTQKVSTLIAAYEKLGIKNVNAMEFNCSGSWLNASGQRINCHNSKGHGNQSLAEAFANSCNPYFAQLVQSEQFPLSAIVETYTRMGYSVNGAKASPYSINGINIPPASTTLTDAKNFDTQWGCLGQGSTLVSPYQLMLWQTAIASGNGKATLPYLIASKTDFEGDTSKVGRTKHTDALFSATAAKGVQDVMTANVANNYKDLKGFNCGVKSGTAQVTIDGKPAENSLLTGFCLDDNCPIAFCIVIEGRKSSDVSTSQIAQTLLKSLSNK